MKRLTTLLLLATTAGLLTACTTDPATAVKDDEPPATRSADPGSPSAPTGQEPDDGTPVYDPDPLPCGSEHVEAALSPLETPDGEVRQTSVVVTNLGPDPCVLVEASELEFHAGGDGAPLGIHQVAVDEPAQQEAPVLQAGSQASMAVTIPVGEGPSCLDGGTFAQVTMPGDEKAVEARFPTGEMSLPPVCGAVQVTSWHSGGAPGVAPN
jgi:hypothetical protein